MEALNLNKNFSLFSPPHTLYWAVIHSHSRKTKLSWNNLDDRHSLTVCSSQKKKKEKITSQPIFDVLSISRSILQWQIKTSVQWTLTPAWMQLSLVLYSFHFFCPTSLIILSKCPESLQKQLTNNWWLRIISTFHSSANLTPCWKKSKYEAKPWRMQLWKIKFWNDCFKKLTHYYNSLETLYHST